MTVPANRINELLSIFETGDNTAALLVFTFKT
jgi:hypothetical protein